MKTPNDSMPKFNTGSITLNKKRTITRLETQEGVLPKLHLGVMSKPPRPYWSTIISIFLSPRFTWGSRERTQLISTLGK
jgi:hypothetical protein